MTYALGVDLGTTYTAAAVHRHGMPEVVTLGQNAAVVPSAVFVPAESEPLVANAALRRGATQPDRLAREFKRRMGDSVPLIVGGAPWSAEALTGRLLSWVVRTVATEEGGPPTSVAVTYPANWREFKQDRLAQALRMAELQDVATLTEPEAAATSYAAQGRVPDGQVIAVYDLGGGTFDAAVLRKAGNGFELLGLPEGVERLGGVDIDEAVFAHVWANLGKDADAIVGNHGNTDEPDEDGEHDPAVATAVARLRADCVEAKEALSSDTGVSIPVALPGLHTEVRLTRRELEDMARPLLESSMAALRRAIESAHLSPDGIDRVLLVGGASRMPLVARMVSETFGRPFYVDANPKHAVALGAALDAHRQMDADGTSVSQAPQPSGAEDATEATAAAVHFPTQAADSPAAPKALASARPSADQRAFVPAAPQAFVPAPTAPAGRSRAGSSRSPIAGKPVAAPRQARARISRSHLLWLAVATVAVLVVVVAVLMVRERTGETWLGSVDVSAWFTFASQLYRAVPH